MSAYAVLPPFPTQSPRCSSRFPSIDSTISPSSSRHNSVESPCGPIREQDIDDGDSVTPCEFFNNEVDARHRSEGIRTISFSETDLHPLACHHLHERGKRRSTHYAVVADAATRDIAARLIRRQSDANQRMSLGRARSSSLPEGILDRVPSTIIQSEEHEKLEDMCVSGWYDDEEEEESDNGQVIETLLQRKMSSRVSNRMAHMFGKFSKGGYQRTAGRNKG